MLQRVPHLPQCVMEHTRARDGCIELEKSCSSTGAALGSPNLGPFRCHAMRVIALGALNAFIHATPPRSAVRELALPWYRRVKLVFDSCD